jgi:hypothetical protein
MSKPNTVLVKANRNFVLVSTFGHAIQFKKDQPTPLPAILLPEALMQGVVPVDEQDLPQEREANDPAPLDPVSRAKEIKAAIIKLRETNHREDFGATGNPKVGAVERVLGWKTSAKEIEPVLQSIFEELAEAKLGG